MPIIDNNRAKLHKQMQEHYGNDYDPMEADAIVADELNDDYGEHNILINNMYNSAYDTPEAVIKDMQDYDLSPWQKEKVLNEIVGVFGMSSRDELNNYLKGIK